jgi:hypothetical protein
MDTRGRGISEFAETEMLHGEFIRERVLGMLSVLAPIWRWLVVDEPFSLGRKGHCGP